MVSEEVNIKQGKATFMEKLAIYASFAKLRLAYLVVFSAVLGYFIAAKEVVWLDILFLSIGGFLVTGSSNGFNQIWERDVDKLMDRTKERPLPTSKMTVTEGLVVASLMGVGGTLILWQLNALSGILGMLALVLYVLVYTPLKPITPIAVFVGAFPGSIPPMLGYVAYTGEFGLEAGILFLVQFFWQFPHFWAIAWKCHDDYKKGGFHMLPSLGGRDKKSAHQILLYTAMMVPVGMLPWATDITGSLWSMIVAVVLGAVWIVPAFRLYKTLEMKYAAQVMYYSFLYLPIILVVYLLDKA